MEKALRYDHLEFSNSYSEGIYLRKPIKAAELKRLYPQLRGIAFEFDMSAFKALQYDHQANFTEILEAFDFEEVTIRSYGRLTHLPDVLWKPSLRKLELSHRYGKTDMEVRLPASYNSLLDAVELQSVAFIDPRIFDSANLQRVIVGHYTGSLRGISKAANLEYLHLSAINTLELDIDFHQLNKLKNLDLINFKLIERLPDVYALQQLQSITLSDMPLLKELPKGFGTLGQLRHIKLSGIGSRQAPIMPFLPACFSFLEKITVYNCFFDFSVNKEVLQGIYFDDNKNKNSFWNLFNANKNNVERPLTAYRNLHYFDNNITELPAYFFSKTLENIQLVLPQATQLPPSVFECKGLKIFTIESTKITHFGEGWQQFSKLEAVQMAIASPEQWPDFGKENIALGSLSVKADSIINLPASWAECPGLASIHLTGPIDELPLKWASFPKLTSLRISNGKDTVYIRKEMALVPGLSINLDCPDGGRDRKIIQQLNTTLDKANAPEFTRLVFGKLLLEKTENDAFNTPELKTQLLQAVNINHSQLRDIVFDAIHLLNPQQKRFSEIGDLSGKQLYISGKTRLKKTDYKEKLQALGVNIANKPGNDVDCILMGDACPDIPAGFWDAPHWFCTETELDKVLKKEKPGFMQTLENNELDALWQLIWSNDPASERVVLEMLRKGGIPDAVIPDLVVVAKTSKDTAVRNDFRNLLKAKAPEELRSILSNTRDMDKILQRFKYDYHRKPKGLAQMTLCHYRRSRNPELLKDFFIHRESLDNPFRSGLFREVYPALLERPHYINIGNLLFTTDELNQLLSDPLVVQGKLKRLLIRCAGDTIPEAIFNHPTLNELRITTDAKELPAAIGRLKRLQTLDVLGNNLCIIPDELAQMATLKRVGIASPISADQWQMSEALRNWLNSKHWMPRNMTIAD